MLARGAVSPPAVDGLPAARRGGEGGDRRKGLRFEQRAGMAEDPELDHDVAPAGAPALGGLRRRGIYLLPNLFTTGVLFCGFFAIVQAMNGRFETRAVAIFFAMSLSRT